MGILGSSAPVNIPGSGHNSLGQFSPSASSPLHHLHSGFLSASRFSHQDQLDSGGLFMNNIGHNHGLSSSASKLGSTLYDFNMSPSSHSPLINNFPVSPRVGSGSYDGSLQVNPSSSNLRNKRGPRTDPCGTPCLIIRLWELNLRIGAISRATLAKKVFVMVGSGVLHE
ncbi:hypothetical protein J6590_026674 [Homalodisca vitripennis]|nr:hypothetical protein J6590_026674 [Homalodisca vitripennis]